MTAGKRSIGSFTLAMIAVSAIVNLRGIPTMASMGLAAIGFYLVAALTFLIPSALVCAELTSTITEAGGVYIWVSKALGHQFGFLAIWMEWINNVIAIPATLSTLVLTLSFAHLPLLANNKMLYFTSMLIILWGVTFYNFLDLRMSSWLNIIGALAGTLLPALFMITLGLSWLMLHQHTTLQFTHFTHYLPAGHVNSLVFFLSVLSGYSGMQVIAFHSPDVTNAHQTFPRAILFATILIILVTTLTALAMAMIIPPHQINIVDGMIAAFSQFFSFFHLPWLTPILACCMALGIAASLSAWLLGPARGVQRAAQQGFLSPRWARKNQNGMPSTLLLIQAVIGTLLASLFLWLPSVQTTFWLLVALTSQFTVLMFILVFSSAIVLRYRHGKAHQGFHIPGGKPILAMVCGMGIIICLLGFLLGFFPPAQLQHIPHYVLIMLMGDLIILALPFCFKRNLIA